MFRRVEHSGARGTTYYVDGGSARVLRNRRRKGGWAYIGCAPLQICCILHAKNVKFVEDFCHNFAHFCYV